MRPGERNVEILKSVMSELGISEIAGPPSLKKEGLFYSLECPSKFLNLIKESELKDIPRHFRNRAKDIICERYPEIFEDNKDFVVPKSFETGSLSYDFVLFEVKDGKIQFKTFEIQGEGHFYPVFGIETFVKTILSDVIKDAYGTQMIYFAYYNNSQKKEVLKDVIKPYISNEN